MPAALPAPVWVAATVPKRGNRAAENEDATAAVPDGLRFAVADGATEGWESGPWSAHLVAAYIENPPNPAGFPDWLAAVRNWAPPAVPDPVPWYVEEKRAEGSFATLAGLELRRPRRGSGWAWRAVPLASTAEFGNRPALVPSSTALQCPQPGWFAGRARPGDLFLLATDAAAARLLDPLAFIVALAVVRTALSARDPAALADWCRAVQDTTNDDVSVLAILLPGVPPLS